MGWDVRRKEGRVSVRDVFRWGNEPWRQVCGERKFLLDGWNFVWRYCR